MAAGPSASCDLSMLRPSASCDLQCPCCGAHLICGVNLLELRIREADVQDEVQDSEFRPMPPLQPPPWRLLEQRLQELEEAAIRPTPKEPQTPPPLRILEERLAVRPKMAAGSPKAMAGPAVGEPAHKRQRTE